MPGDILFQPLMFRNLTVKNRIFRLDPAVSEHHPRDETLDGLLTISRQGYFHQPPPSIESQIGVYRD